MISRRRLLAGLGLVGAASTARTLVHIDDVLRDPPNSFNLSKWHIAWRDFCPVYNQNVEVAFWCAMSRSEQKLWASTTLGVCARYNELDQIDCTRTPNGSVITVFSSAADRKVARDEALKRLLVSLKTGNEWL